MFVVGLPKVRHPYLLYRHQNLLREQATGEFGRLCKDVSRSPAMIQYLDLQRSRKGMPNENFARELFELFMLGEGNYTEKDIKEAARAFTGYKSDGADFRFAYRQHDDGYKTVFGDRRAVILVTTLSRSLSNSLPQPHFCPENFFAIISPAKLLSIRPMLKNLEKTGAVTSSVLATWWRESSPVVSSITLSFGGI